MLSMSPSSVHKSSGQGSAYKYIHVCLQGCNGLPESGVADKRTWLSLLGEHAQPNDMYEVWALNTLAATTAPQAGRLAMGLAF